MAGNPQVFGLLEEMLDSGKTPEEVCRDCPELLPEVQKRWKQFRSLRSGPGSSSFDLINKREERTNFPT
jgi:hypothetical protein